VALVRTRRPARTSAGFPFSATAIRPRS